MKPFCPFADDTKAMRGYYELPARVLEDTDELTLWMARAIAVAASKPVRSAKPRVAKPRAAKSRVASQRKRKTCA
jgi:TfoX/Sxy family transcriptional regulator of competence genes